MRYVGFIICSLIGFVIGNYLLTGAAAAYASVLISYHLYLVFLILLPQKEEKGVVEKQKGLALPIGQTIVTHAAFLALVVGLPYLRHHIPFFGILKLFIPALAPFEVKWLFNKEKKMKAFGESQEKAPAEIKMKKGETFSIDDLINTATADDHEIFLAYLRQPNRAFRKPGLSIREEYGYWLVDRAKNRAAPAAATATTAGAASSSGTSNATNPPGQ